MLAIILTVVLLHTKYLIKTQNNMSTEQPTSPTELPNDNMDTNNDNGSTNNENEAQVQKLQSELQEQNDKYLRLFAEFQNYKRRTSEERLVLNQTAGKDIIVSLLDVLDDMDRAEKQIKATDASTSEGTLLVFNKFRNILKQKGLTPMESVNVDFDVEKHEAISELEVAPELKGKVIDEAMKGYYLNEKLIRFAKVVVGK